MHLQKLCPNHINIGNFPFPSHPPALNGIESLCFSLQMFFSSDVCSVPNSWTTRNQRHGFMVWWHWQKFWSRFGLFKIHLCKFGQLILGKILKIVATSCHILRLKCTKFNFGWGTATTLGELTALPRPPKWIWGPTVRGGEWREGKGRRGGGKGGKAEGVNPSIRKSWLQSWAIAYCFTAISTHLSDAHRSYLWASKDRGSVICVWKCFNVRKIHAWSAVHSRLPGTIALCFDHANSGRQCTAEV